MSLRLKLLLLGLATLVLPLAGYEYAREMEAALRDGEQQSLQAIAQTIATSLQGRTDLLYRQAPPRTRRRGRRGCGRCADGSHSCEAPTDPDDFKRGPYDLEPLTLAAAPFLDGYTDDWPHEPAAWQSSRTTRHHQFAILAVCTNACCTC